MPLFNNTKPKQPEVKEDIPVQEEPTPTPVEPEINTNIPDVSFIVEDGSIVPSANSYTDLDFADEYCANKGYDSWTELTDVQKEIAIIRGTEFVNNFFNWKGRRKSQFQSLAFPRMEIIDNDGYSVLGIPVQLKKACLEAAYLVVSSESETLFSTKDENGNIKRQKVDSLEVEYFADSKTRNEKTLSGVDYTSIYDILNYMLKGLYITEKEELQKGSPSCTQALWEL